MRLLEVSRLRVSQQGLLVAPYYPEGKTGSDDDINLWMVRGELMRAGA